MCDHFLGIYHIISHAVTPAWNTITFNGETPWNSPFHIIPSRLHFSIVLQGRSIGELFDWVEGAALVVWWTRRLTCLGCECGSLPDNNLTYLSAIQVSCYLHLDRDSRFLLCKIRIVFLETVEKLCWEGMGVAQSRQWFVSRAGAGGRSSSWIVVCAGSWSRYVEEPPPNFLTTSS